MKKQTKTILISLVALALVMTIGVSVMMSTGIGNKFQTYIKEKKEEKRLTTKEGQLAYLKEHEQEIVDFVKQSNAKIESVQIDWTDVRWGEASNGTPQGGGDIVDIYGTFNNIEDSGWNVTIEINDGKPDMETMMLSNGLGIGGQPFE